MASSSIIFAFMATLLFSSTMGHSQMRCAKYNTATGTCEAPIRNAGRSFLSEAYDMSTGPLCHTPMTNPITASYANGASCESYAPCPLPMGTYTPGETFTVMWFARNHATPDQTPGNISLYLSPPLSLTQGADATLAQFQQNRFCSAPFTSCNGQNGDTVQCTTQCTMPSNTAAGIYTIWWKWAWPGHTQVFSTCSDIYVVAGSNTPAQTPAQTPTPATPSTTPASTPSAPSNVPAPVPVPKPSPSPVPAPAPVPKPAPSTPVAPISTPSSPSSPSVSSSCSGNTMRCLTATTYSMCNRGSWGASQSCGPSTMCTPNGEYIYCVNTNSPVNSPSVTPATSTSSASTPAQTPSVTPSSTSTSSTSSPSSSTPASSGSCTLGYQQCVGTNKYQTCGNGRNAPEWAAAQSCQAGLSCHASATANNVYCY